jgi:hypothetical protein
LVAVPLTLLAGCSSAGLSGTPEQSAGALTTGSSQGTVLVSGEGLTLKFGVDADKKTPIAIATRGGKSRTLKCESFVDVEDQKKDQVSITCSEELVAGYDWCEVDVSRSGPDKFDVELLCEYTSQPGQNLPASLAATYEVLSGEQPPSNQTRASKRISMDETAHATDPYADEIAFTEALVPSFKALLDRKQTVVSFRTRAQEEVEVTRIAAHPHFADHATQLGVFAQTYSAHGDSIDVDESGKLASSTEIVSRVLKGARCVEGPSNQPFCIH